MTVMNQEALQQKLTRLLHYLSTDPDNQTLRADVFDAALSCGALEEAQFQLTHALHLQAQQPAWRHRQALLAIRQNRYEQAQTILEELTAAGHADAAISYNLAYVQFALGETQAAI